MATYIDYEFNQLDMEKGILSSAPSGVLADVLSFLLTSILNDDGLAPRSTFLSMPLRVRRRLGETGWGTEKEGMKVC